MLCKLLRSLMGDQGQHYGLHSFRVGGAQALALAGRSIEYLMARGRWRCPESVARYVEAPTEIAALDSSAMAKTQTQRRSQEAPQHGQNTTYTHPIGRSLLPRI